MIILVKSLEPLKRLPLMEPSIDRLHLIGPNKGMIIMLVGPV